MTKQLPHRPQKLTKNPLKLTTCLWTHPIITHDVLLQDHELKVLQPKLARKQIFTVLKG